MEVDNCSKRILIFGCSGTVGSFVIRMLLDGQCELGGKLMDEIHLTWHCTPIDSEVTSRCNSLHQISFEDPESLAICFEHVKPTHIIFMLPTRANNRPATQTFIKATQDCAVYLQHLQLTIWISEGDIDTFLQKHLISYTGVMEAFADMWQSKLPVIRLEPTGFYQNFDKFFGFKTVVQDGSSVFKTGIQADVALPWVDAYDVASAAVNICLADSSKTKEYIGRHYRLCGESFSMNDFVSLASQRLHRSLRYATYTKEELRTILLKGGVPESALEDRILAFTSYHEKHFPVMYADQSDLEHLIGTPTPLATFWVRHYQELGNHVKSS